MFILISRKFLVLHHLLDLLTDFLEHFLGLLVFHESHEVLLVEVELFLEVHDDVLELEFHVAPVVAVEVAVVAVPDWPSEFSIFRLVTKEASVIFVQSIERYLEMLAALFLIARFRNIFVIREMLLPLILTNLIRAALQQNDDLACK